MDGEFPDGRLDVADFPCRWVLRSEMRNALARYARWPDLVDWIPSGPLLELQSAGRRIPRDWFTVLDRDWLLAALSVGLVQWAATAGPDRIPGLTVTEQTSNQARGA